MLDSLFKLIAYPPPTERFACNSPRNERTVGHGTVERIKQEMTGPFSAQMK
jgi:hypothetical protein